jgi:hypothetical protein
MVVHSKRYKPKPCYSCVQEIIQEVYDLLSDVLLGLTEIMRPTKLRLPDLQRHRTSLYGPCR